MTHITEADIAQLHRRIDSIEAENNRLKQAMSAPTIPIYDNTNFPQDAVEGQIAFGTDGNAWKFQSGIWSKIGGAGGSIDTAVVLDQIWYDDTWGTFAAVPFMNSSTFITNNAATYELNGTVNTIGLLKDGFYEVAGAISGIISSEPSSFVFECQVTLQQSSVTYGGLFGKTYGIDGLGASPPLSSLWRSDAIMWGGLRLTHHFNFHSTDAGGLTFPVFVRLEVDQSLTNSYHLYTTLVVKRICDALDDPDGWYGF